MKLNIHLVSHPIIENLSEIIVQHKIYREVKNNKMKHFGLLLTYEAVRDWIQIYRLNIRQIKSEYKFTAIDPKESFVIIINKLEYFSYFHEIKNLLPKIDFVLIREDEVDKTNKIISEVTKIDKHTKVIIVLDELRSAYIIKTAEYLIEEKQISANQIRLISTLCTEDEIVRLSQKHNCLNIYTSKIL